MSEWWTYRLSDFLMFSPDIYGRMVARYLSALGPVPWLLTGLGVAMVALAARGNAWMVRWQPTMLIVLAMLWAWVGWAFHWQRFAQIHTAAPWLAMAFALQAVLLLFTAFRGFVRREPRPVAHRAPAAAVVLALAGVLAWPLASGLWGQSVARAETFGLMPEPTALATCGLLWMSRPAGWQLCCVVPVLSLLAGFATLWAMAG